MKKKMSRQSFIFGMSMMFLFCFIYSASGGDYQSITTNKEKLIKTAVIGQIAPASPSTNYLTTWDGKPKMGLGTGGINYDLKLGKKVFGWANGERATMGVAASGTGTSYYGGSWTTLTSIGNQVKVLSGEARGEKGIVIGKFGRYVLIHFEDTTLNMLTIGSRIQAKASGVGLQVKGYPNLHPHGIAPEILEKILKIDNKNELWVSVVKKIPAEIIGQGAGSGSLTGNWHIQTCYPPDIKTYGLDQLRFGDLVILEDIQTDYGKGYYKGGTTLGVVCTGPSDMSGLGVGVTPILSTRTDKINHHLDPSANIAKYLGIDSSPKKKKTPSASLKTNKDRLITTAVEAVIQPTGVSGYSTTYDGKPKVNVGMGSINYTVSIGDSAYGWASADHVEPDVTVQGRDRDRPGQCAIALLACIGNEARILTGDAKGARGFYIGRHAGSDDLVWFPKNVLEQLTLEDRIQVRAQGVGLKIDGFEDVRINKLSPRALENMGIKIKGKQLIVPVAMEVPGHIMGSGLGYGPIESLDYDIQTTDPYIVKKYNLKKIRLGDIVAITDEYDAYGTGRHEGAVTIGVCIHGWSDMAGHGPGINPIMAALPGRIKTKIDPDANMAYYLGIKQKQ